jgi:anthranilate phosphoribosyltransferase
MKKILSQLYELKPLSREQAKATMIEIGSGAFSDVQVAAFLSVYNIRPVTLEEMLGIRDAMLELCLPIHLQTDDFIDMCGTGGDGKDTFNISTLAAFVAAGAGVKVAKHGNYAVSSACGSSNVLEYLGVRFSADEHYLQHHINTANITILHAPLFHPAMKQVAPVRKSLQVKTLFNIIGPLVNPAKPSRQVTGVFNLEVGRLYHYLMQHTHKDYCIIHSLDGYDEISLTGAVKIFTKAGEYCYEPKEMLMPQLFANELFGGESVDEAAEIFMKIIEGKGSPAQIAAVVINAAWGIRLAKKITLSEAIQQASESLNNGNALMALEQLKAISNGK